MNILEITKNLHSRINSSSSPEQIFILSKVIENLNVGSVKTVATYTDLLDLYPQKGEVYFVEDEQKLYYGMGQYWYPIIDTVSLTAYSWGVNNFGYLGDGTTTDRSSPVSVVGGFTDWVQVACGKRFHSLGIRANGTAWAWGSNDSGRLGDGTQTNRSSPVSVVGGFTDWVQVAGSSRHSLGVRANGTAWAWGGNSLGYLGNGTYSNSSSPVSVVGGFTDWVQVACGYYHSLGVRANGSAWAWGYNGSGRLGDGTTVEFRISPVSVVGGFTDWVQVNCGSNHSLGLRANGTAWAWGDNFRGQLGDGTTTSRLSPVSVVGGFTDWVQLSGGYGHSLGLRANGTAWAWGVNNFGHLGDGTSVSKSSPVSVIGGFTDWVQVFGGGSHSLGLRANGTAWAWGLNGSGRLGDGTTVAKSSPVSVVGGFTDWVQVSGGNYHSLGIRSQKL